MVLSIAPKPEIDKDLVEMLEEVLADARSGEVTGVLLCVQRKEGVLGYRVVGVKDRWRTSGFLYHALHKLQDD